jgi:protein phosphatase
VTTLRFEPRSLLVLAGPAGSGKTYWASRLFAPTWIVSSDQMRALIADDENDQSVSAEAHELLAQIVSLRLARGRCAIADSTALEVAYRCRLVQIARAAKTSAHLIVFAASRSECLAAQDKRARQVPAHAIDRQLLLQDQLLSSIDRGSIAAEGFSSVRVFARAEASEVRAVFFDGAALDS